MLRKLLILACVPLVLLGCSKLNDLSTKVDDIDSRLGKLETLCAQMNKDITALQKAVKALEDKDYVTSVEPITEDGKEIGYRINFTKSGSITIYHGKDGADGLTPVISVSQDTDGLYYWTIDGEWLLDSGGNKIKASATDGEDGITPQLKIEENWWYISYDAGQTWTKLSTAKGDKGDSMFSAVTYDSLYLYLTLANGTKLTIPMSSPISLEFDIKDNEAVISAGETIVIGYTVTGSTQTSRVSASSDGNYVVKVKSSSADKGTIEVTAPTPYADGYINVIADNGNGYTRLHVISFSERKINFPSGLEYSVATEGGTVEIPFTVNFDYTAKVAASDAGWLSIAQTKAAERAASLSVVVGKNDGDASRSGKVYIYPLNGNGEACREIVINQASAYFSISKTLVVAPAEGGEFTVDVRSSRGLTLKPGEGDWFTATAEADSKETGKYSLKVKVNENNGTERRSSTVELYSEGAPATRLGTLEVLQSSKTADELKDMVFVGKAAFANDFTIYLPLAGEIDCYIDWGDGTVEHNSLSHKYNVNKATEYEIRISGKVTALYSGSIPQSYRSAITAVKQWGSTDLKSMFNAFAGCSALKSLPADETGAFAEVTTFEYAFSSCKALETIPDGLFKYCGNVETFYGCFSGCSALTSIPSDLFSACKSVTNFSSCFSNCSSLTSIPDGLFSACKSVTNFSSCFSRCSALTSIPEDLFAECAEMDSAYGLFKECENLLSIPAKLFAGNPKITSFYGTFEECNHLTSIPEGLFDNCPDVNSFSNTFRSCNMLKSVPISIFDNNRRVTDFSETFCWCGSLVGESPYSVINGVKYHLYERVDNPDEFVAPISYSACFYGTCFSYIEQMPDSWRQW